MTHNTRRSFLRLAALSAGALATGPALARAVALRPHQGPPPPDLELTLEAVVEQVQLRPGPKTEIWRYRAAVVAGDPAAVAELPGPFPGPLIRVRRGWVVRVHFVNRLPEPTVVHWHGLNVPEAADGHPRYAVGPGGTRVYDFAVLNESGPYWFHPHPDARTGPQVYWGQAGLLWVADEVDSGLVDLPLAVQDRTLSASNALVYRADVMGFLGDEIWVNGQPNATLEVPPLGHRLRILNGSNTRIYKLAWQGGRSITVVGTDGGALAAPVTKPYVMLAPGQRLDVLADFADPSLGREVVLESLAFRAMPDMGGTQLPSGTRFPVASFRIRGDAPPPLYLPAALKSGARSRALQAFRRPSSARRSVPAQDGPPDRTFQLQMGMPMGRFTINGRSFEMDAVAPDEVVKLGAEEVWEFANQGAGMGGMGMMTMAHAMHLHLVQFRVVGRDIDARGAADYATVQAGLVDEGWQDTVLVMPFERVRIRARFLDFPGLYLYHCHMLEHEDLGMMRNFRVVP